MLTLCLLHSFHNEFRTWLQIFRWNLRFEKREHLTTRPRAGTMHLFNTRASERLMWVGHCLTDMKRNGHAPTHTVAKLHMPATHMFLRYIDLLVLEANSSLAHKIYILTNSYVSINVKIFMLLSIITVK